MLTLTITVAGNEIDYSRYVQWETVSVQEQINLPSQLQFSLTPSDAVFQVPPQRAYVRLYSQKYDRTLFTGFIATEPTRTYLGLAPQLMAQGPDRSGRIPAQLFQYGVTCTSDEYLLNCKAVPFIPAFVNRTQGEILADIAQVLCQDFFDFSNVASGDIVPYYQYDPTQSWSEIAKKFADGSRYRYKVRDKQIYYQPYGDQPLGITYDERDKDQNFDPKALQTTVLNVPLVNDVTIIGDVEAGNNWEDYFVGDGFTGNFPLLHKVFRGSSVVLLQESWNNADLDTQKWELFGPTDAFDFSAGALNMVNSVNYLLGSSFLAMNNGLELAGSLDLEAGEISFNGFCDGIIDGLYTDNTYTADKLIGGFVITTPNGFVPPAPVPVEGIGVLGTGASGIVIQPWWSTSGALVPAGPSGSPVTPEPVGPVNGFAIGPPIVTQQNHSYVLQIIITAPRYVRFNRFYRTVEGEEFGGSPLGATGNIQFNIQDYDILAATGFYYQPVVHKATVMNAFLPSFAAWALLNQHQFNLTLTNTLVAQLPLGTLAANVGPSGLFQPSGLILPGLPHGSGGFVGPVEPWPSFASGNTILLPPGLLSGTAEQEVMGNGFMLQVAQVQQGNSADTLAFYGQTLPAAGTRVRFQSWEAQAAVSRLQDKNSILNEALVVGDNGLRSAIVTDLNPLPRTSEDCDAAALAYLADRTGVFYNGTYTITSLSFQPLTSDLQLWPTVGRFLNVNSPRRGIDQQKFLVTALTVTVLDAVTELVNFQIQFGADLYLEKVLKNFVDLNPPQVLTPKDTANPPNPRFTVNVDDSFLPDLVHLQADPFSITDFQVPLHVLDDYFGPIEVRRLDTNWGRGRTRDYIGTFMGPIINLVRQQFDQVWYLRPVGPPSGFIPAPGILGRGDLSSLPTSGLITSRRSKVIRVRMPQKPALPVYVGQNGSVVSFDFNGDIRNIYGFEIRAISGNWQGPWSPPSGYIQHVLWQHPVASVADLMIDLAATPFAGGFDFSHRAGVSGDIPPGPGGIGSGPGGWFFVAYFWNQLWSYSDPLPFIIGPTGIGPRIEWGIEEDFAVGVETLNTPVRISFPFNQLDWNVSLDRGEMPVGSDAIFDVELSPDFGTTWNSIFSPGPTGNPFQFMVDVKAGGPNHGSVKSFAIRGVNINDWVRIVCKQKGSTTAGRGLQGILY